MAVYYKRTIDDEKIKRLRDYIMQVNRELFGYDNCNSSYLYKIHSDLLCGNHMVNYKEVSNYESLKKMVINSLANYRQKHYAAVEQYISTTLITKSREAIINMILPEAFYSCMRIVDANTEEIFRMVINAIYSFLFSVEIEDSFVISKRNL